MEVPLQTSNAIRNLADAYNSTHIYKSFPETPETAMRNAVIRGINLVPASIPELNMFVPLPGDSEYADHTEQSAIYAASSYMTQFSRAEQMQGFNGTETPGLQYSVINAHAFCDSAFFLKPRLQSTVREGFSDSFANWSWRDIFAPIFGGRGQGQEVEGFEGSLQNGITAIPGLRVAVAEGFMGTDTKYFDSGVPPTENTWSSLAGAKSKIIATGFTKESATSFNVVGMNLLAATGGVITDAGMIKTESSMRSFSIMLEGWFDIPAMAITTELFILVPANITIFVWIGRSGTPIIPSSNNTVISDGQAVKSGPIPVIVGAKNYIRIMYGYNAESNKPPNYAIFYNIKDTNGGGGGGALMHHNLSCSASAATAPSVPAAAPPSGATIPVLPNGINDNIITTTVVPPDSTDARLLCSDLNAPDFKAKIRTVGGTVAIEFFGYLVANVSGKYLLNFTNDVGVIYSARIWMKNDALVLYAIEEAGQWNGWSNISGTSPVISQYCFAGDRIPVRILYTQQNQGADKYNFGISVKVEIKGGTIQPAVAPIFVVRKDSYGKTYEPAVLAITAISVPQQNKSSVSRLYLRHLPIIPRNNKETNDKLRTLAAKTYYNITHFSLRRISKEDASGGVYLYPDGKLKINNRTFSPSSTRGIATTAEEMGCFMYLNDVGDVVIEYVKTSSSSSFSYSNKWNKQIANTFERIQLPKEVLSGKMVEEWMMDRGEWPVLGSPLHTSKQKYWSQTIAKTKFYSRARNASYATFGKNTKLYSKNGRYMLSIVDNRLVVSADMLSNRPEMRMIFSISNKTNVAGGTYLVDKTASTRYLIPPTAEILGQTGTYTEYKPSGNVSQKLGFPPILAQGASGYTKTANVSAGQCKTNCDALNSGCSHYYAIVEDNVPGCVLNTNAGPVAYLPKSADSHITQSKLYIKNKVINSGCEYTGIDPNTGIDRRVIQSYNGPPQNISTALMRPFIPPKLEDEGACGIPEVKAKLIQLEDRKTESFAGYDTNICGTGNTNSNSDCQAKIVANLNRLSTYTAANSLATLNQNAVDIRAIGDEIIGTTNAGGNGSNTRFSELTAATIAEKRSKYLNPRDTLFSTTAIRLSDTEKSVSQQNTMFVMGIAASVAVGLFAVHATMP